MNLSKTQYYLESSFGSRVWCGEDCTRTGKCQRKEHEEFDRLHAAISLRRQGATGSHGRLSPSDSRRLFELYRELQLHCATSTDTCAAIPWFVAHPKKGRWLVEFARHFCPALAELEDQDRVPHEILYRVIEIATTLTTVDSGVQS